MDKPANAINISICAVNFLNAIFLLIFTGIFNGPGLLIGVVSVIFFLLNAIFALVLLLVVLIAVVFSFLKKNPDTRYQAIADNRGSFIKSQTALTTELDALAFTARGGHDIILDDKALSLEDDDSDLHHAHSKTSYHEPGSAPTTPSIPFFPADHPSGNAPPSLHEAHSGLAIPRSHSPYSSADSGRTSHSGPRPPNTNV